MLFVERCFHLSGFVTLLARFAWSCKWRLAATRGHWISIWRVTWTRWPRTQDWHTATAAFHGTRALSRAARLASWAYDVTRLRHRPPGRAVIAAFGTDTALLVIDPQAGVLDLDHWGGLGSARSNAAAEDHIAAALTAFRDAGLPVMFTQHCSREPDSPLRVGHPGHAFLPGLEPRAGETVVSKDVNSGYVGTRLEIELRRLGIRRIVHAGMFTNMCVATTVRMSGNLGFDSYLADDATFCCDRHGPDGDVHPADLVQSVTVASLHGEFCTAIPTDAVVTLTRRDAAHLDRRQGNEPARHAR